MKLSAFFLLAFCLHLSARTAGQTVTLDLHNVPVQKVFKEASRQTGISIIYNENLFDGFAPVTVHLKDAAIEEVLKACLKDQPFEYSFEGNLIVIKKKQIPVFVADPVQPFSEVHGHVTDSLGKPLAGASITVKGSRKGTETDINGDFVLKGINDNATLIISFTGYTSKMLKAGGNNAISIFLVKSNSPLDEIQVIAYGQTTMRYQTGNVSTVTSSVIEKQPVSNALLALEGRVPGLQIIQSTGVPGGGVTVRIQGQNSLSSGNDPLYVIDGVPYTSQMLPDFSGFSGILGNNGNTAPTRTGSASPLSFINPDDIESIDVLKDADATSIYGSRAAAGAVLITTKKGKEGQTKVDFNLQSGIGEVAHRMDLLTTPQYLEMRHEAFNNDSLSPGSSDFDLNGTWDTTRYTDWQKVLLGGHASYTDAHASVSGGSSNTQFIIGAGYHYETSVFPGSLYDKKGSVHFAINHSSSNKKFHIDFTGNYVSDDNHLITTDLTNMAINLAPVAPALYKSDGTLNWAPDANGNSTWYNPLAYLLSPYTKKVNNLISDALLRYQVIPGLYIKSNFGYTSLLDNELTEYPLNYNAPETRSYTPRVSNFGNGSTTSWIVEPQITFQHGLGDGILQILAGGTFLQNNTSQQQFGAYGFSSDLNLGDILAAPSMYVQNSLESIYKYNAFFGRINYNVKNKYILNVTGRRDGSSRFGPENEFHNFGSVSGAWIFSNEEFVKSNPGFLSFGKFRTSYGTTGNDQIGDYQFMSLYNPVPVQVSYQGTSSLAPTSLSNPYLQWEETKKLEFGLDLGFLKDKIILTANYYYNRSSNQLQSYPLPYTTGFNYITENLPATIQNTGLEISISTINIKETNFSWTTSLNFTIPKNKIVSYPNLALSSYSNFYVVGQPIPLSRGFNYAGIDKQTGLFTFAGADGKNTSSPVYPTDETQILNAAPRLYGGLQNQFKYKGIELDFLFQFVKQNAENSAFSEEPGSFYSSNYGGIQANHPNTVLNRWQKPGDNALFQKYTTSFYSNAGQSFAAASASNLAFSDASFIRLTNLSLSWELPLRWRQEIHFQNAKIYFLGQNLWTFTKFIGMNPESASVLNVPPLRVLTLGIQVTL